MLNHPLNYSTAIYLSQQNLYFMQTLTFNEMELIEGGFSWAKCALGTVGGAGAGALSGVWAGGSAGTIALPVIGTVSGALFGGALGGLFGGMIGAASSCFD